MWSTALLLVSLAAASTATPYVGGFAADHSYSYRGGSAAQGAYTFVDASGQEPVRETPEVARARQQHLEAVAEAVARQRTLHGAPVPHSVHTARAPQPVADTPEVAAARAHHLAIVQDAHARAGGVVVSVTPTPLPAVAAWSTPYAVASTPAPHAWGVSSSPAPVQDTVEVAAAKAKHLAAVEEAKARVAAASSGSSSTFHQAYSAGSSSSFGHQTAYSALGAAPLPVHDTVEVAAARAQHLSAVAEAASRVSIASQYAAPAVHAARLPAPAPAPIAAPAWHARPASVAVRFNTIASVDDASGRYIPDDEGQYDPRLDAEGQYDPRYDAEGQYDPRLNAEGQYVPSLHDEGQWVPSANEGQYVQGRDGSDGEDNMPYSYSYSDGLSSKTETKTADGITRGRFSYVDANGVLQAVNYEADNYNGFRASGTNLPQPPSAIAAAAAPVVASARVYHPPGPAFPAPVEAFRAPVAAYAVPAAYGPVAGAVPDVPADTPEVAAAKAAHFAAHREAGARLSNAYGG